MLFDDMYQNAYDNGIPDSQLELNRVQRFPDGATLLYIDAEDAYGELSRIVLTQGEGILLMEWLSRATQ